jgi:hypothetical protein
MVVELMCMILSPRWIHDVGEDVGTAIKRGSNALKKSRRKVTGL